jgi:hypothetical protein
VRYCELCRLVDPDESLLVLLQYRLCLSYSDLWEIGFGMYASCGNATKLYVRDPKSYDWDCKLIVQATSKRIQMVVFSLYLNGCK